MQVGTLLFELPRRTGEKQDAAKVRCERQMVCGPGLPNQLFASYLSTAGMGNDDYDFRAIKSNCHSPSFSFPDAASRTNLEVPL